MSIRIYNEANTSIDAPTVEQVYDMLDGLALDCRFVLAERSDRAPSDQHFIQVYLEDDLSTALEYREGDEAHHFGAHLAPETAIETLTGIVWSWIVEDGAWRAAIDWLPLEQHDTFEPIRMIVKLTAEDSWLAEALASLLDRALQPTAHLASVDPGPDTATIVIEVRDVCWDAALAIVREVFSDSDAEADPDEPDRWDRIMVSRDNGPLDEILT